MEAAAQSYARMTVASLLRGTVRRRAFAGHGPNELGAAEAAVLRRWIVVVLACLEYSRSELRVGGENIRVRKRKRSYQFHQRWGAICQDGFANYAAGSPLHRFQLSGHAAFGFHSFSLERRALRTGPSRLSGKRPIGGLASRRFALPGGSSEMAAFTSLGPGRDQ